MKHDKGLAPGDATAHLKALFFSVFRPLAVACGAVALAAAASSARAGFGPLAWIGLLLGSQVLAFFLTVSTISSAANGRGLFARFVERAWLPTTVAALVWFGISATGAGLL